MIARRLESDGDTKGALAALERAEKLDPTSAEVLAERRGLHARQNEGAQARERGRARPGHRQGQHRSAPHPRRSSTPRGPRAPGQPPGRRDAGVARGRRPSSTSRPSARRRPWPPISACRSPTAVCCSAPARPTRRSSMLERVATQAPYLAEPYVLLAEARSCAGEDVRGRRGAGAGRGDQPALLRLAGRPVREARAVGRGRRRLRPGHRGRALSPAATCACGT